MRFTVIWTPRAETHLMDLWSDFPFDRSGMTEASEEINQLLREDPLAKGRFLASAAF